MIGSCRGFATPCVTIAGRVLCAASSVENYLCLLLSIDRCVHRFRNALQTSCDVWLQTPRCVPMLRGHRAPLSD
eukprot:4104143-Amphidinium_carterae.1